MLKPRYIAFAAIGIIACILVWIFFFRSPAQQTTALPTVTSFGTANTVSTNVSADSSANGTQTVEGTQSGTQKIFKIADGPVTGATFIQTTRPTTTIARYVKADNGHVSDLTLDVPGAVARAVSNTTIPGSVIALWAQNGAAAILQYFDNRTIKTLGIGFPVATTTSTSSQPVRIQFFPDSIVSIALSPDGKQAAYLQKSAAGVDGFISKSDGTGGKKLFSLALSQTLVSWPSANTLMVQTKSSAGAPGIVFSVDVKTGNIIPLIYASGITAIADRGFTHIVYQTTQNGPASSYARDTKKGTESSLSFNPIPEKCIWSMLATSTMYCAGPLEAVPNNYLDLWHAGTASVADNIFSYDLTTGKTTIVAVPGGTDGGAQADIAELALSPDEKYLLFVTKGDRSVWGVRLTR